MEYVNIVDSICKEFGITNWTINDDGSVDVDGNVGIGDRVKY